MLKQTCFVTLSQINILQVWVSPLLAYFWGDTGTLDQFRGDDQESHLPAEDSERRTVSINGQPRCLETEQNNLNLYQQTSGGGDGLDSVSSAALKQISSITLPLVTVLQKTFHL